MSKASEGAAHRLDLDRDLALDGLDMLLSASPLIAE